MVMAGNLLEIFRNFTFSGRLLSIILGKTTSQGLGIGTAINMTVPTSLCKIYYPSAYRLQNVWFYSTTILCPRLGAE